MVFLPEKPETLPLHRLAWDIVAASGKKVSYDQMKKEDRLNKSDPLFNTSDSV